MKKLLGKVRDFLRVMWGEAGAFVEPELVPETNYKKLRGLLTYHIDQLNKLVEDYQDFPVDREAYNLAAHRLMCVRMQLDEMVKHGS